MGIDFLKKIKYINITEKEKGNFIMGKMYMSKDTGECWETIPQIIRAVFTNFFKYRIICLRWKRLY